jgi:predicted transcriptional regulator
MSENDNKPDLPPLVAEVVAAYVSNHKVEPADLPILIQQVYQSFLRFGSASAESMRSGRPEPAVSVRKSVMPEFIVCLEDGKKLKMLKRYLKSTYNLTPEAYRERWGLPVDYPMVAPNYAKQRSRLAKEIGLGTKGRPTK